MEAKKAITKPQRSVLGRGLSALISSPVPVSPKPEQVIAGEMPTAIEPFNTHTSETPGIADNEVNSVSYVKIERLVNNPNQPRQEFKEGELLELSLSIKSLGVLQPILVRPAPDGSGSLEIVAGERRWRAAKLAKLTQVPVITKHISDLEALEVAIVENIQRSDLNPVEEARSYQRLMDEFGLAQQDLAERVGKDRASVANYLRVLKLPPAVVELLQSGKITMGHAKAILTIKEPSAQLSLAKKVVDEELSVRNLEALVSRVVVLDSGRTRKQTKRAINGEGNEALNSFPEVVDRMRTSLGTKVAIKHHESGRGRIEIEYFSEQELDRLAEQICR